MDDVIVYCEREGFDMSKKSKNKKGNSSEQEAVDESTDGDTDGNKENTDADEKSEKPELEVTFKQRCFNFIAKIPYKWVLAALTSFIAIAYGVGSKFTSFMGTIDGMQSSIKDMQSSISDMQDDINGVKNDIASMKDDVNDIRNKRSGDKLELFSYIRNQVDIEFDDIKDDIEELDKEVANVKTVSFNDVALSCMEVKLNEKGMYEAIEPNWKSEEIIAVDPVTNETFSAVELADQRILVPYESNGQEILFCGQYNKRNHWDGKCIVNVYVKNVLSVITEAVYSDGVLIKYKQAIPAVNKSGKGVWVISDRIHNEDFNSGNSWSYVRNGGFDQRFKLVDATPDDVLTINQFKKEKCEILEGFYHGNTSDGEFNDNTGNAYLVKYDLWGYVRTLYVGKIKDGDFEDKTGNAWYIVRNDDTDYIYYKGVFQNGSPDYTDHDKFINPFSLDEIYNIVKKYEFNCDLPWYDPDRLNI